MIIGIVHYDAIYYGKKRTMQSLKDYLEDLNNAGLLESALLSEKTIFLGGELPTDVSNFKLLIILKHDYPVFRGIYRTKEEMSEDLHEYITLLWEWLDKQNEDALYELEKFSDIDLTD